MLTPMTVAAGLMAAAMAQHVEPKDCRNQTWTIDGGNLAVLSWHIHYNTVPSDQERFYEGFVKKFQQYFPPADEGNTCPFGPNYSNNSWPYVCSLEGPYKEHSVGVSEGGSPWSGPQRAFFITNKHIDEAWAWAQENKGLLDVLKHPNTGCMHDDHSVRAEWNSTLRDKCETPDDDEGTTMPCKSTCAELIKKYPCDQYYAPGKQYAGYCDKTCGFAPSNPKIDIANFPCNMPGTGCNDTIYPGPPACGCASSLPEPDDAPAHSCKGCVNQYFPSGFRY